MIICTYAKVSIFPNCISVYENVYLDVKCAYWVVNKCAKCFSAEPHLVFCRVVMNYNVMLLFHFLMKFNLFELFKISRKMCLVFYSLPSIH